MTLATLLPALAFAALPTVYDCGQFTLQQVDEITVAACSISPHTRAECTFYTSDTNQLGWYCDSAITMSGTRCLIDEGHGHYTKVLATPELARGQPLSCFALEGAE